VQCATSTKHMFFYQYAIKKIVVGQINKPQYAYEALSPI
jgi:hypothetical protein